MFLIGGGREPDGVAASHAPFLEACDGDVLCVCLDEPERWTAALAGARVRTTAAPAPGDLEGVRGVYVAGGLTPAYWDVVCTGEFGAALRTWDGVYAGFSAGAAIAAGQAIVGGWRIGGVPVCDSDFGEELDEVDVRPGLGLCSFAVDVHASQWGTLTRLVQAVSAGLVSSGVAVDEHTCVEVRGEELTVHGWGRAYRVGLGTCHVLGSGS
ncbi:MAG: cyanophycinase [Solirubrobacteraceae bacterium]|nr:cyanophycinase [Solirubrobacteraceae bacterium]